MAKRARTVALIGALDTKGAEYDFVQQSIRAQDLDVLLIDVGVLADPRIVPNIASREVARAAGFDLDRLRAQRDRGKSVEAMSKGLEIVLPRLCSEGRFHAVLAFGGTGGTSVACRGMRRLPVGLPKIMVSTVAGGDVSSYVDVSDIIMIPSIVDVSGLNRISRGVFLRAVGAVIGMLSAAVPPAENQPLVVASMFGNTTPAVETAKSLIEKHGFEVVVFHATGRGGRTLESLVDAGLVSGVLDLTTTEWADELVGGVMSAGPRRLEAAARTGTPAVVAPGCLDMVNFGEPATVPERFKSRRLYAHNPNVTLLRTDVEESALLGEILANKLNKSAGPARVFFPRRGLSMIGAPDGPFWWPEADAALLSSLRRHLHQRIPLTEVDANINAPEFARLCAEALTEMMTSAKSKASGGR